MSESPKEEENRGLARRAFLRDAGLIVGGVAIGSLTFANACKDGSTLTGPATTVVTNRFVCPVDGKEFPSLAALKSHYSSAHPREWLPTGLITLSVNGVDYTIQAQPWWTAAFVLRDKLGLFGTKVGCDRGECGSCTILSDGLPVLACLMLAVECQGKNLTTIEGLSDGITLSPLQQKFYDNEAFQCGFCTPGFIIAAQGLLNTNPKPTADDVRLALSGHICTCQNFKKTIETVTGGV